MRAAARPGRERDRERAREPARASRTRQTELTPIAASTLPRMAKNARAFTTQGVPNNRLNVTELRVSSRRNATPSAKKCGLSPRQPPAAAPRSQGTPLAPRGRRGSELFAQRHHLEYDLFQLRSPGESRLQISNHDRIQLHPSYSAVSGFHDEDEGLVIPFDFIYGIVIDEVSGGIDDRPAFVDLDPLIDMAGVSKDESAPAFISCFPKGMWPRCGRYPQFGPQCADTMRRSVTALAS